MTGKARELWRITASETEGVTADRVAGGAEAGRLLLEDAVREIGARLGASALTPSPEVTVLVDECAELLEDAPFRRAWFALAGRRRSQRPGFSVMGQWTPGGAAELGTTSAAGADRVRAFERACKTVGSFMLAAWDAADAGREGALTTVARGQVGAFVLGEVEATLWTVRRALVRLQFSSGRTWSAERRRCVYEAGVQVSEAWQAVSKVHAALDVSGEAAQASVEALRGDESSRTGRRLRNLEAAVGQFVVDAAVAHEHLTDKEVRRVFAALQICVDALEEVVEAARALIGYGAGGEGAWSLPVGARLLVEVGLDLESAGEAPSEDGTEVRTTVDIWAAVGTLAALSVEPTVVVPAGSEVVALEAAAGALWAAETALMARQEGVPGAGTGGVATGAVAARLKLAEAATAVDLTDVIGGPAQMVGEDADDEEFAPVVRAMRALWALGEDGAAIRYGEVLQRVVERNPADELATLGRAVMAIAMAVNEVAGQLAGRCRPAVDEWLAAAAITTWSAAEELLLGEED